MNTDWWNYGGLTRDVLLVQTPATFIAQYHVGLKAGTRDRIEATVQLDGSRKQQKVTVTLAGLGLKAETRTDASGVAHIEFPVSQMPLWSPERPALHDVVLSSETDQIADRIGFRTIKTAGTDILLNDKPVFLRGICIHEENPIRGGGRIRSRTPACCSAGPKNSTPTSSGWPTIRTMSIWPAWPMNWA